MDQWRRALDWVLRLPQDEPEAVLVATLVAAVTGLLLLGRGPGRGR
jgi:hypothetical protein